MFSRMTGVFTHPTRGNRSNVGLRARWMHHCENTDSCIPYAKWLNDSWFIHFIKFDFFSGPRAWGVKSYESHPNIWALKWTFFGLCERLFELQCLYFLPDPASDPASLRASSSVFNTTWCGVVGAMGATARCRATIATCDRTALHLSVQLWIYWI